MDEILRRKLLADGEGSGEDRRMQMLIKTVLSLFSTESPPVTNGGDQQSSTEAGNSPQPDNSSQVLKSNFYKVQNLLQQCETSAMKSSLIQITTDDELLFYREMCNKLMIEIDSAHSRIAECKKELADAKQIRKQRQEYDALGLLIKKHAARTETHKRLEMLKQQKKLSLEKREQCLRRMEERKKRMHVLVLSLMEITNLDKADQTSLG